MSCTFGSVGAVGGLLSLVPEILGLVTAQWIVLPGQYGQQHHTEGLWRYCSSKDCSTYNNVEEYTKVVRAFMVIGSVLLLAGFGSSVVVTINRGSDSTTRIIFALYLFAAISVLAAMIIYTANVNAFGRIRYGYSYYFGWLSFALSSVLSIALGAVKL